MLTARSASVLADVLNGPAPVRLRDLSARYNVSERTAKHDIQQVRDWLLERGVELRMNTAEGFHLDGPARQRTALLEEAYGAHTERPGEDRAVTVAALILRATPTSINIVAEELGVARNTVLANLPVAESLLRQVGVRLQREPTGLSVEEPVHVRRSALVQLVRTTLRDEDVVQCTRLIAAGSFPDRGHIVPALNGLIESADLASQLAADVRSLTMQISESYGVAISDAAVVGLFIRLLAVVALPSDQASPPADSASAELLKSLDAKDKVLRWTRTAADVDFALFEIGLRISSERLRGTELDSHPFDVGLIARTLISDVDRRLGMTLLRDGALLPSLINHLSDRLVKVHHGILEPNPVLDDVIAQYPEIHRAVRDATRLIFEPAGLTLDETDCAFLTVHFATALQRHQELRRYRALLVCGTGRGTTELIRSVVETQMPEIDVVATCSVFSAGRASERRDIDLVISTFPFTTEKPLAVIRSIPTGEDLDVITSRLADIGTTRDRTVPSKVLSHPASARAGRSYEELILLGFELTRDVQNAFGQELSSDELDGLRIHCLFLARRIANAELYAADFDRGTPLNEHELIVDGAFKSRDITLPHSELAAIAAYFRLGPAS